MNFFQEDLTKGIDNSALFLPSISSIYVKILSKHNDKIRGGNLPAGIPDIQMLNFLDKDKALFYYPYTLYSLGHAVIDIQKANIAEAFIQKRDRKNTFVMGDSGGYQISKGIIKWPWGDESKENDERLKILRWLEHTADLSMTLDVPYLSLKNEKARQAGITRRSICLDETKKNLQFFIDNRIPGATKFLNIVQGESPEENDTWFDAIKEYNDPKVYGEKAFEGWAFGGLSAYDFDLILRRLIIMRDKGILENTSWLHYLGSGKVHAACAYTELQTVIRNEINPKIVVSYDAASPFVSVAHGQVYVNYIINNKRCTIPMGCVVDNKNFDKDQLNLPFQHPNSPIGQRLTIGDICVNMNPKFNSSWDGLSYVLLMAHSLYLHIKAIQTVNFTYNIQNRSRPENYDDNVSLKVRKGGSDVKKAHLPTDIFIMRDIIRRVFSSEHPFSVIANEKKFLQGFMKTVKDRKGNTNIDMNRLFKASTSSTLEVWDEPGIVPDVLDDPAFAAKIKQLEDT